MKAVIEMLQQDGMIDKHESAESVDQKILNYMKGLTPEQRHLVYEYFSGPARTLAIPGSGKTHTMIVLAMKLWLLFPSVIKSKPNVRIITFTRKAAGEARERLCAKVGHSAGRSVTTYHALAVNIYMNDPDASKFWPEGCSLKDFKDYEQKKLVKQIIEMKYPYTEVDVDDVFNFWNYHSNEVEDYEQFLNIIYGEYSDKEDTETVCAIIGEILDIMRARKEVPMGLIIPIAVSLMKLRKKGICRYLIVDEFQDTNASQFEFSVQLVKPYDNICAVGDKHQAIYRWRGAKPENLDSKFLDVYPETITYDLTRNFRSTQNILKAGSLVLPTYYNKEYPHVANSTEKGTPISLHYPEGPRSEAEHLVEWIRNMHEAHALSYEDIYVLYRSGGFVPSLEKTLFKAGIPYVLHRGTAFFGKKEVMDFVAYCRWSLAPQDFSSARRVINWPRRGAGKKTIESMNFNYMKARWPKKLQAFQSKMIYMHQCVQEDKWSPLEWARYILNDIGLFEATHEDKLDSYSTILEWMADFAGEKMTPKESINEMLTVSTPPDDDEPRVQIMTIHGSKGLEAEAVYICHAVEGNIPGHSGADTQEECHLMYVAITRAKRHLCISCPQRIFKFGKLLNATETRFIDRLVAEMGKDPDEVKVTRDSVSSYNGGNYGGSSPRKGNWKSRKGGLWS